MCDQMCERNIHIMLDYNNSQKIID